MPTIQVRYEQAVYGSFSFWDKGYAVLAQSPGCRPAWLADLRAACQRYGERPPGAAEGEGLFALRLPSGPWAVVGIGDQGADDRGRPGALAFHALFLSPRDYRKAGASPFPLAGALRRDWGPETRALAAEAREVERPGPPIPPEDERARRIASALARGHRVAFEADRPIDALAEVVWRALPERVRRRASVATWAFGNGNRFDLVALPRLAGVALDASYLDPSAVDAEAGAEPPPARRRPWGRVALVGSATALGLAVAALARRGGDGVSAPSPPAPSSAAVATGYPDRSAYRDERPDPEVRARVAEGLLELAEKFGVVEAGGRPSEAEPTALMVRLADRLRYRGPYLTADELARLADGRDEGRRRALAWHAQVRRFAPDRPLPADFARGPLRWQLDTLAWSFHLDADPRLSAAEVPHELAHALAVEGPIRPIPPADRYPALAAYARFLGRLPRR